MADKPMSIGERLEEARKRKGISIREAAEATKVRGDYLLAMENNSFEINLPEIYIRGFLKIYVNYLRLDLEQIMVDYDALRVSLGKARAHSQQVRRDAAQNQGSPANASGPQAGHASLGRMDMPAGEEEQNIPSGPSPLPPGSRNAASGNPWLRPVLVGVGALVIGLLIVLAAMFFAGRHRNASSEDAAFAMASARGAVRTLTLRASDTVTVWIIRKDDNVRVFGDTLSAGQTQKVDVSGTVEIRYSNGKALQVERDGKRMAMSEPGMGKNIVE